MPPAWKQKSFCPQGGHHKYLLIIGFITNKILPSKSCYSIEQFNFKTCIMRTAMLMVHFLGLAMGLGTSFGFFFLGRAGSKMEKEKGKQFALNSFAMGRMGHIGLAMLIVSGLYLFTPFWSSLASRPLLMAKLVLVLTLTTSVILTGIYTRRAKKDNAERYLKKIKNLGRLTLLSGIAIVVLAVLVFK
jgi:uncharacterized membrane protein